MASAKRTVSSDAFAVFEEGSNVDAYLATLDATGEETGRVQLVPLDALQAAAWQPRRHDDAEQIAELAESIRDNGLLHPITVRPIASALAPTTASRAIVGTVRYEVVAGHRRWAALKKLAAETSSRAQLRAPVLVKDLSDLEARILTTSENLDRRDLSAYETALGIANVRNALRDAGQPHDLRVIAKRVKRADGPTSEYVRIADAVTEAVFKEAGLMIANQIDYGAVVALSKDALLRTARATTTEARAAVLRQIIDAVGRRRVSSVSIPRDSDSSESHETPTAVDDQLAVKRDAPFRAFTMKLTRPLAEYSQSEAREHLAKLAPVVAALAEASATDRAHIVSAGVAGVLLFIRAESTEESRVLLDRILDSVNASRHSPLWQSAAV